MAQAATAQPKYTSTATASSATPLAKRQESADPVSNPVYQIITSDSTPEEKRAALAKFRSFVGTREETRERDRAYREAEEWLQTKQEAISEKIIELTDTKTVSELKSACEDQNRALMEFDEKMTPFLELLDAVNILRLNGKTMDAFREIQTDKVAEEKLERHRAAIEAEVANINDRVGQLNESIALAREEKTLGGLGRYLGMDDVKLSARQAIATDTQKLRDCDERLGQLSVELNGLDATRESSLGEFVEQKDKLRRLLLDVGGDEHNANQRKIVELALNFINTSKTRSQSIREHLDQLGGQVDNLYDYHARMSGVQAILSDGVRDARDADQAAAKALEPVDGESTIARMTREERQEAILDHVAVLGTDEKNAATALMELTGQSIRVKTMRDANRSQVDLARIMHSQGITGVANRLSVVLTAVGGAALGEASAVTKDTMEGMILSTNEIARKEVVKAAMGIGESNSDIIKAMEDLSASGDALRTASGIARESLTELRENISKMDELVKDVHGDLHAAIAVHADVDAPQKKAPERARLFEP